MDEITFENDFFKMKNAIDSLLNDKKIPNVVKQEEISKYNLENKLKKEKEAKNKMTDEEITKYFLEKELKKEKEVKNKLIKDFTNYFENNDDTSLVL